MTTRKLNVLTATFVSLFCNLAAAASCPQIAIPSYFYPGPAWTEAISSASKTSILVLNPNSGPGASVDSNYSAAVSRARSAGIKVLGYVHTSYGARSASVVKSEVSQYMSMYEVDGIFFDETATSAGLLPYYRDISAHVRSSARSFIVLNPGTFPDEGYMNIADTLIVFEDSYAAYLNLQVPSWAFNYPASKFWHAVHTAPDTAALNRALELSAQRNAGKIFITDDIMPNPYDTLPSYFSSEVMQACANPVQASAAASAPIPTPTPAQAPNLIPSLQGTIIPSASAIIDSAGALWTLASRATHGMQVLKDGNLAGYTANVSLLLYYSSTVYQQNTSGGWWSWSGSGWMSSQDPRSSTAPVPVPALSALNVTVNGPSMQIKTVGGTNFDGSWNVWANGYLAHTINFPATRSYLITIQAHGSELNGVWPSMNILVDGKTVKTFIVDQSSNTSYSFNVSVSEGARQVAVAFTNDAYDPSTGEDRNLYVHSINVQ